MRTSFRFPAAALALALLSGTAPAQTPPPPASTPPAAAPAPADDARDPTNAALLYYKAWLLIPEDTFKKVAAARPSPAGDWTPDAETVKLLKDADGAIHTVLRAGPLADCRFGMEWSQGVEALLPHLGKVRDTARLLSADLRRLSAESRPAAAAERLVGLIDLSRHAGSEPVLISALVSVAVFNVAADDADWLAPRAQLGPDDRAKVRAALDRMDAADPFNIKAAIRNEKRWAAEWLAEQATGPQAGAKVVRNLQGMGPGDNAEALKLAAMDEAQVKALTDLAGSYYDQALAAFDAPDAEARLKALERDAAAGKYGVIVQVIGPAFGKVLAAHTKGLARLQDLRQRWE
jgi:hypothetical protein